MQNRKDEHILFYGLIITTTMLLLLLTTTSINIAFAQKATSSSPTLGIVSSNGFSDNNKFLPSYHIVGEVQNNGTTAATYVQVSATLYDSSGQVIGTGETFTNPSNVAPNSKAPFEVLVLGSSIKGGDVGAIDHYAIQVSSS